MVAFVLNCDPFLPPDGSGLFGFELAADLVIAEPLPVALLFLAAIYFVLLALNL